MPTLFADLLNNTRSQGLYNHQIVKDVLIDCNKQLDALKREAKLIVPLPAKTKLQRWSKAVMSMRTESTIQQAGQDIQNYQQTHPPHGFWFQRPQHGSGQGRHAIARCVLPL